MAKFTFHYETDTFTEFRDEIISIANGMGLFDDNIDELSPADFNALKAQSLDERPMDAAAVARLNAIAAAEATLTDEASTTAHEDQFKPEPVKVRKARKPKEAAPEPVPAEAKGNGAVEPDPIKLPEKISQDDLVKLLRRYEKTYGYQALTEDIKATLQQVANVNSVGKLPQDRQTLERAFIALSLLNINNPHKRVPING